MNETVLLFLVVIVASFLFSLMMSQIPVLRVPSAISYLLFGILLQKSPIQLPTEELHWLSHLGDVGLLFLMFLSGLEVDMRFFRTKHTGSVNPLVTASSIFFGTVLSSFVVAWIVTAIAPGNVHPYMLALLLSTTSLGVIVPVLEEKGILHGAYGQTILLSALIADVSTMLLVSLYVNLQVSGQLYDFLLAIAIVPGAMLLYGLIRTIQQTRIRKRVAGDASARLRAVVALVAAGCAFADYAGSEPILGSFLVGVVISAVPMAFAKEIRSYCHGLGYGLLVPMFFLSVGLNFHLTAFASPAVWQWTTLLVSAAFLVKLVPSIQLRKQFGTKAMLGAGLLLSTRLSLVIAAANIAVAIGALPQYLGDAMMLTSIITCLLSPILFMAVMSHSRPAMS